MLAPIGLLLSLIGLTKQPRGFAIAGTIIGLIGSIFLALMGVGIVMTALGLKSAAQVFKDYADAHQTARQVYLQLDQQRKQTGGGATTAAAVLTTAAANTVAAQHNDPWGTPLRAEVAADGSITIMTAGRDKKFDTADDLRFDELALQSASPTTLPSGAGGRGIDLDD